MSPLNFSRLAKCEGHADQKYSHDHDRDKSYKLFSEEDFLQLRNSNQHMLMKCSGGNGNSVGAKESVKTAFSESHQMQKSSIQSNSKILDQTLAINACSPGQNHWNQYISPGDCSKNPQSLRDENSPMIMGTNICSTPVGPQDMSLRKNNSPLMDHFRGSENIYDDQMQERKTVKQKEFLSMVNKYKTQSRIQLNQDS